MENKFQEYSHKNTHFYYSDIPLLLESAIKNINHKDFTLLDLGCGDGRWLYVLQQRGLLTRAKEVVGVDLSPVRIKIVKRNIKSVKTIISDACSVKELKNKSFDFVICSNLIEHVKNDELLLSEIKRVLKDDGVVYFSSVIKKWYGTYIYKVDGKSRLDPTHLREYSSKKQFLELLRRMNFIPIKFKITPLKHSVFVFILKITIRLNLMKPDRRFFLKHSILNKIHKMSMLPIMGYQSIEVFAKHQ